MKSINKIIGNHLRTISTTSYFKMSMVLVLLFALYGGYLSMGFNYLEGFISILSSPLFFVFGVLVPFLVISLCTHTYFDKNEYLISRLSSKKKYLITFILTVFIVNCFVYVLMIITIMIALNLFPKNGFGFLYNPSLHCHNLLYLGFILVRLFCIIQIISIFSMLLCKIMSPKIVILLNMALYGSFLSLTYLNVNPINQISQIPLYIGNYLIISKYKNFGIELFCTFSYFSFLCLITYVQFILTKKKLGDIKI